MSNYVARKVQEAGLEVLVDGIELNRDAIAISKRRFERDRIPSQFIEGDALDAIGLLGERQYDAVIAYELIEHVVDPNDLLDVCEDMVAPGGRIYISTPDGTFGEGNNPHHLHCWRAVDLYELIRRRGTVEDMLMGADGITTISYTPSYTNVREVAIYCGPGWQKWHPTDIERKGLGGSETAAVRLAEAISDYPGNYCVTVYGEVDNGAYKQIAFRHHTAFDPTEKRDVVIVSRNAGLLDRPINTANVFFWAHDTDYGPAAFPQHRADRIDRAFTLSQWHREHFTGMYPALESKTYIINNGIEPKYFRPNTNLVRNEHRAIYTSSPDRGLDLVLELWPDVRKRVPDAELYYAYADVYDAVADQNPALRAFRDKVKRLADQPGVYNLGALPQPGVAAAMMEAGVWLAPSYNTMHDVPFNETFCIGAVEAAAAGCTIVASDWGALPERVKEQAIAACRIPLTEDGKFNGDAWVRAISDAMIGEYDRVQSPFALDCTWDGVAQDMLATIGR